LEHPRRSIIRWQWAKQDQQRGKGAKYHHKWQGVDGKTTRYHVIFICVADPGASSPKWLLSDKLARHAFACIDRGVCVKVEQPMGVHSIMAAKLQATMYDLNSLFHFGGCARTWTTWTSQALCQGLSIEWCTDGQDAKFTIW